MKLHPWLLIIGLFLGGCSTETKNASRDVLEDSYTRNAQEIQRLSARISATNETSISNLEKVATFEGPMPTGITVSRSGRVFVNFPRWGDPVPFTVAELKYGKTIPYPNAEINQLDAARSDETFVSVQSVVVDPRDRLWALDTGSIKFGPTLPTGPKLVGINLSDNRVFKRIHFPSEVALVTSYLNDMRFDLRKGRGGVAYITDSSDRGANAIIVVDLFSGHSWRRLNNHPSTKAENNFVPIVEGQPLMQTKPGRSPEPIRVGADGVAISNDGSRLYYCPLASRRLYSVATEALLDQRLTDAQVAETVRDEGEKPASDGLESDAEGRLYITDYEHNSIVRRNPEGRYETIVQDPRLLWPDTLSVANDGFLYCIANQLHRQPNFHDGTDLRVKPYSLFRLPVDAAPVQLGSDEKQVVRERDL